MQYPDFFDAVESISLIDPLADFLGAFEDGRVTFNYLDIVKNAGHSCPAVAGAYLMTLYGLKALYKDETPKRGEIKVCFKEEADAGVSGVMANVVSHITGAAGVQGFKGVGEKFVRANLLTFGSDIEAEVSFTRVDTNATVTLSYDASQIALDPRQKELMVKILKSKASQEEIKLFKTLWQKRVQEIFIKSKKLIELKYRAPLKTKL